MENLTGQRIDRYEILELLGKGGMAMVYKAYDTRLERELAIKIIRRDAFPPEDLHDVTKRFEREAKSLARLSHPNIVKVMDYGEYEGSPFLVLEYFPGGTLKQKIGGPVAWQEAARLLLPIARGVEYAHNRGVIHRDIKPANILMTEDGEPTLSDFGIAKLFQGEKTTTLTGSGAAIGTPEYMAPEQWTGQTSPKSDMYSLGVVLYEMVTGRRPYIADTPGGVFLKQMTEPLPLPGEFVPNLPESVGRFLLKALAKEPADRYADLGAFIKELESLLSHYDREAKEKAEREKAKRDAREKAERVAAGKAAREKAGREAVEKAERDAQEKAERVAAEKAAREKAGRDAAEKAKREKAERAAREKAERDAAEKAALEKAEREAVEKEEREKAERAARKKAERDAAEKAAREKVEREAVEKAEREKAERDAKEKIERVAAEKAAREKAELEAVVKAERDAQEKAEHESAEKAAREKAQHDAAEKAEREKRAQERAEANRRAREAIVQSLRSFLPKLKIPALILFLSFIVYLLWQKVTPISSVLPQTPVTSTQTPSATQTLFVETGTETPVSLANTATTIPTPTLGIGSTMIGEDGATLVYVPAGEFIMGSDTGNHDNEKPAHTVYLDAFWIDQTEVTNKQYAACVAAGGCYRPAQTSSSTRGSYYGNSEFDEFPVIYVNWDKTKTYCEWAGRRLPTEAEWEKAARGTDGRIYPWGNDAPNDTLLNYNGKVGDTTKVGSYETGKSFYGAYDMAGNVREWVNDWYSGTYYQGLPSSNPLGPDSGQYRVLRGGAWNYDDNVVRSATRNGDNPTIPYDSYGFRCARSLSSFTPAITPVPVKSTPIIESKTTLGIGSTMVSEKDGMTLLYVPAGKFTMGSDANSDEQPIHQVTLDAYWIDQTEVTNAKYAKCVAANKCNPPYYSNSTTHSSYYGHSEFGNYPVINVDWNMAKMYCEWADRRLPTEAEWEKAARGTDGRTYPWGDESPNSGLLNYDNNLGDITEVGKYPDGKSVYGVYDMAGNVWEWMNSFYKPYPYDANDGREALLSSASRVLRGGSWFVNDDDVRSANRNKSVLSVKWSVDIGFRCAGDVSP